MQTTLEQLAEKVDSFDAKLRSLTVKTTAPMSTTDTVDCESGSGELASEEESNKRYLRSLDVGKVSCIDIIISAIH